VTELDDLEIGPSGAELHLAVINLARDLARDWNIELGCTHPDDPAHGFALHARATGSMGFRQGMYLAGLRERLRAAGIDTDLRNDRDAGSWIVRWSRHPAAKALEQFVGAMRAAGWTVDLGENGEAEVTPPPDYAERWRNESIEQKLPRALGVDPSQRADLPVLLELLADLGIHVQYGESGWLVSTPGESILRKKWTALALALHEAGVVWDMEFRDGKADVVINRGREQVTGQVHAALLQALERAGVDAELMREDPPSWRVLVRQSARASSAEPDVGNAQVRVTTGVNDEGQRETFVELSHEGQCRDFLADLLAGHAAKLHDRNEDRAEPRPEDQPDFYGDDVPDDGPTGVQCVWEGCSRTALYCKEHAVEMADFRNGVPRSPEVLERKLKAYREFEAYCRARPPERPEWLQDGLSRLVVALEGVDQS